MRLKQFLKGKLSPKQIAQVRRAFDVIGDIAIIEIPPELEKKEKIIAQALLKMNKNIKVVAKKAGVHKGVYRTQKLKIIAGERRKKTEHKESGVRLRLDVEKCYFSPRLGTERLRIARQVKPGETILVMFSGTAPYPLVLAKHTRAREIHGIEINPAAHKYAQENVALNKLENKILLFQGDVKLVMPGLAHKYDRIIMPLPHEAERYLSYALRAAKKGARLHFYDFQHEKKFSQAKQKVLSACKKAKKKCRITKVVACGQVGVRQYRVCVDATVA